jgi:hypothetical protein
MKIKFVKSGGIPVEIFNKMFIKSEEEEEENLEKYIKNNK